MPAAETWETLCNPPVFYKAEKGAPVRLDSAWFDAKTKKAVSNTFWAGGSVDFSGARPRVEVDDKLSASSWPGAGRKFITYLLHPEKWRRAGGRVDPANGFLPTLASAPYVPVAYALEIEYRVPVKLNSDPKRPKNPRGWFAAHGEATLFDKVGEIAIIGTPKRAPVYAKIVVHEPGARAVAKNPPVFYKPEKGPPVKQDSAWFDATSRRDVSNTTWATGIIDFSGAKPHVEVYGKPGPRGGGSGPRRLTYLLHPGKWEPVSGSIKPASGMIPNVCSGPGAPLGYALAVRYDAPVTLVSDPARPANPRAWFASKGAATALRKVGTIRVLGRVVRVVPVYDEIVIHAPGRGPKGAILGGPSS